MSSNKLRKNTEFLRRKDRDTAWLCHEQDFLVEQSCHCKKVSLFIVTIRNFGVFIDLTLHNNLAMNSSPPASGRAPLQFAAHPSSASSVGVSGSFDSTSPSGTEPTSLEAMHLAARYNGRPTRSNHSRNQGRTLRFPAPARSNPARSAHGRSRSTANMDPEITASPTSISPDTVPSRTRKRSANEATADLKSTKSTPRKRARAKATNLKKPPPSQSNLVESPSSDSQESSENVKCCICMCEVESSDLASINGCEHQFCFGCIEKWSERENTCPLCKNRFTKIDRMNKKRKKGQKNTKKVKQRDQRSDLVSGAALEGLLATFATQRQLHGPLFVGRLSSGFSALDTFGAFARTPSFRFAISSGGDSSDDDDISSFVMRSVLRGSLSSPIMPAFHHSMAFASRINTSRSYASNSHDRTAGSGIENPLTIDDSDSDDDDDIVVLSSRNS